MLVLVLRVGYTDLYCFSFRIKNKNSLVIKMLGKNLYVYLYISFGFGKLWWHIDSLSAQKEGGGGQK